MELKKIILISLTALGLVQCTPSEHDVQEVKGGASKFASAAETIEQGECYDLKMDEWFSAFNKFQEEGDDMQTADRKATIAAEAACSLCLQEKSKHVASENPGQQAQVTTE